MEQEVGVSQLVDLFWGYSSGWLALVEELVDLLEGEERGIASTSVGLHDVIEVPSQKYEESSIHKQHTH